MRNSAVKTFHFGADFMEALEDHIEDHLVLTALIELLRATPGVDPKLYEQAGHDLRHADAALVRLIRKLPKFT